MKSKIKYIFSLNKNYLESEILYHRPGSGSIFELSVFSSLFVCCCCWESFTSLASFSESVDSCFGRNDHRGSFGVNGCLV